MSEPDIYQESAIAMKFHAAAEPLVKWLQEHGCPEDQVIVQWDRAEHVKGNRRVMFKVPD